MADVICVGIASADILISGVDLTTEFTGETKIASSVDLEIGGDAANEAITMAHLGVDSALMCGIADDGAGAFIKERVRNAGVDGNNMIPLPHDVPSALNVIMVRPDGERNFINIGAPADGWKPDTSKFGDAKIVSLASFGLPPYTDAKTCLETAKAAKEQGRIVCADMVLTPNCSFDMIAPALAYVDYFFPNMEEAAALTGKDDPDEMADIFLSCGAGNIIIKTGKEGCFIRSRDFRAVVPGFTCDNVVDTTGAGDNFLAGFMTELLAGKPVTECCRFACGVAAVSIQKRGATTGVQSRQQVETAIRMMS